MSFSKLRAAIMSIALLPVALTCRAQPQPPPPIFIANGGWICSAMGWLTYSTDSEKITKGQCYPVLLAPERVVVLDADYPIAFVCLMSRGATFRWNGTAAPKDQMLCGYTLQSDLRDERGQPQGFRDVQQAAARSTVKDVHRLPPTKPALPP